MIWLLAGGIVVALALMAAGGRGSPADVPVVGEDGAAPDTPDAPLDQLELLQRYGTAEDAARLIAEGRGDDLAGLGYRPGQ